MEETGCPGNRTWSVRATAFAAGGLGPQKPEGSRCSKMHSLAFPGKYFHYFTF